MIPKGLRLQDSANFPSQRAPIDLVVPHAGQGMPVNNLIGQTMGPDLKPSNILDANDIDITEKNSSRNLVERLIIGIIICPTSENIKTKSESLFSN